MRFASRRLERKNARFATETNTGGGLVRLVQKTEERTRRTCAPAATPSAQSGARLGVSTPESAGEQDDEDSCDVVVDDETEEDGDDAG